MKSLHGYVHVMMRNHKPHIAMLLVQLAYAGLALFSKAAIAKGMNPFVFVVYRQALAPVALAPFAFFLERNKEAPLSYSLLCRIFFVSLIGIETISIKQVEGIAKVGGVSGALVFAFVKGPPVKFMNWYLPTTEHNQIHQQSSISKAARCCTRGDWIKGYLTMISANILWSLWLVLQGLIIKQYPAKLRFTTLQCFFSCIQLALWDIAMERNPLLGSLGWTSILWNYCHWNYLLAAKATFTPLALIVAAIVSAFLWKETLYWGRSNSQFF